MPHHRSSTRLAYALAFLTGLLLLIAISSHALPVDDDTLESPEKSRIFFVASLRKVVTTKPHIKTTSKKLIATTKRIHSTSTIKPAVGVLQPIHAVGPGPHPMTPSIKTCGELLEAEEVEVGYGEILGPIGGCNWTT